MSSPVAETYGGQPPHVAREGDGALPVTGTDVTLLLWGAVMFVAWGAALRRLTREG